MSCDSALKQYQDTNGHFSLVRNFRLADLVTIMNGVCGSLSIFSSARYLLSNDIADLWTALSFPLAGLMFDFFDGKVARWRKSSSMLGQELDSLADLISFGVAPALLAFVVGLRTYLDTVALTGFICCGLARLARFNATVALVPKDGTGKTKYFEGLPIPSSLFLVGILSYWTRQGWIEGKQGIPLGTVTLWGGDSGRGEMHWVSVFFGLWAAAMAYLIYALDPFYRSMVHPRDVQKLFLQSMLSRGAVPEQLARELWKKCVKSVNALGNHNLPQSDDAWRQFVSSINASLDQLELAFRPIRDQRTGHNIYSIVNLKGDAIAQMATEYTAPEIAYFKAIVEQIVLAPRYKYSVSSLVAMREVSTIKPKSNISKTQAEVVLATFVARGWLIKSKDGRYSLSSRSLMELAPYLQSNYAEHLIKCSLCEEMLTTGIACFHEGCECKIHPYCFKRYSEVRTSGTLTCKICGNEWPREFNSDEFIPIGERAVRKGEHEQRVRMGAASDGEDDDEDYQDEDVNMGSQSQPQPQPQTQTQGRKANRAKGKKTVIVEEEEEAPASSSRTRRNTRR